MVEPGKYTSGRKRTAPSLSFKLEDLWTRIKTLTMTLSTQHLARPLPLHLARHLVFLLAVSLPPTYLPVPVLPYTLPYPSHLPVPP